VAEPRPVERSKPPTAEATPAEQSKPEGIESEPEISRPAAKPESVKKKFPYEED
jgi:hypothetical protein